MARTSLVPQQPVFLSEADNKQLAEMDRQREAFNAAVEKYNQGMMGPGGYNEQLNAYIARLKEIEASGEEVPLPTAPTKMDVPVAPFTEESFVQAQEAAQARAQEAAGQRALAIQAFEDPSRFNLAGFAGLGSRTFAKGGEVKEGGTKASRMMKELGLSKPPKEKTLADEPSKQTPESLAYSLRAQAEGNRDKDLRKESFSAPGALNVKRFEAGGEARSGEGFSPIAGSMGMPGAPEHERMRADTLGFIKRMDDASVMATASRMTGMPFDTPTQARLMLEQLLGGDVSVSAGVVGVGQGMPERVVGYDVGAKFPALGGQMSVGAMVPRGAGKPSFNVGYRKEFKDGGEVTTNDAFIAKHQAGGEAKSKEPQVTGISRLVDFIAQRLSPESFPTAARTLLESAQGKKDPITEASFSKDELEVLRRLTKTDKGRVNYEDYSRLAEQLRQEGQSGADATPSLFSLGSPVGNVRNTLGRFTYTRDPQGNVVVVDKYDFNPPVSGQTQESRTSDYGVFGPYNVIREYAGQKLPPGKGRDVRINLVNPVPQANGSTRNN